jgi:hypothetical protein
MSLDPSFETASGDVRYYLAVRHRSAPAAGLTSAVGVTLKPCREVSEPLR